MHRYNTCWFCLGFIIFYSIPSCFMFKNEINQFKQPLSNWTPYIVGGNPVSIAQYPTSALFFNYGNMCSGTILNSWTILTAAHCLSGNKNVIDMLVQVGTTHSYEIGADRYEVLTFDIHPSFGILSEFDCDIALLYIKGPIILGPKAQKAILINNKKWMYSTKIPEFMATGWGTVENFGPISDEGLMMTKLKLIPNKKCQQLHTTLITKNMLCLYGDGINDTCRGDSGGGVTWRRFVVGIVSHGDNCATINKPSMYTNVYNFLDWIRDRIHIFYKEYCSTNGFALDVNL